MYKVYCDNFKIYDSKLDDLKLINASLELELNKTGSFNFEIYPQHPYFDNLRKMKSIITVYQDNYLLFRGRILNDEQSFYNQKQVTCEGELAFFIDSIVRPYEFEGTPEEYLRMLIDNHNSQVEEIKQFKLGTVTVTDSDISNTNNQITRSDSDFKTTWDLLQDKLINSLGGYLWPRHEADGTYIDYLKDFNILSNQKIEFAKNLLDLKKTTKGEELATAIIPIGGSGDSKITISELTNVEPIQIDLDGEVATIYKKDDYIYCDKAVENYGWIFKVVSFSDIEQDKNYLLNQAVDYLKNTIQFNTEIELSAVDLSPIQDVNPFRLGRYITVKSESHDLNSNNDFLIKKLSIDILNPANNKLTLNATFSTFTETIVNAAKSQINVVEKIDQIEQKFNSSATLDDISSAVTEVVEQNASSIEQSSNEILTQVNQDYYLKSDAETLVESINTQFTQTNSEFEFRFNEFNLNLQDIQSENDAQFQNINKYIKFIDGNIILGEEGNELTLKIQNDRISFLESGVEVAYFSNRKLYVNDGEYIQSLKIGNYSFIPRTNGNLSFKKVT